jgi:hypothetical protein
VIRYRWRSHLKAASSEKAVLDLVGEYLREWLPDERRAVPAAAWPARIETRRDLTTWAFRLGELHAEFEGDPRALAPLQDLLLFATHAAVRITQISAETPAGTKGAPAREE